MNIVYDNIIFALQNAGGISVLWYELLKRIIKDSDINPIILDFPNKNIFRKKMTIPKDMISNSSDIKLPLSINRYLTPKIPNHAGIFHSSYYRVTNNFKIPNITTVHDFTYEYFRTGIAKNIHIKQKSYAIKKSDRIICVSENTKKDLIRFYPNISEERINVVYNGVDDSYRVLNQKSEDELKQIIPFTSKEYILYIGDRYSVYKNFNVAAKVSKAINIPLVIIGGGFITNKEKRYLSGILSPGRYIHLYSLSNVTMNILYNHALCLLYPSSYEGFGIPILEAQKAGCPVIATNVASIPEIIGPVSTLVETPRIENIVELMRKLRDNSQFANLQIKIGLDNSSRFSWDRCYQETKKIYMQLSGRKI